MSEEYGQQSPTDRSDAEIIGALNVDMMGGLMHALSCVMHTAHSIRQDDPTRQLQFHALASRDVVGVHLYADGEVVKSIFANDLGDEVGIEEWHDETVAKFEAANRLPV